MFSLVSGVYESYLAPTQLNLLVVGAGGVGKTALLERLKVTQFTKKLKAEVSQDHVDEDRQPPLPYPFLPLALREELRLRGESFHSHQSNHSSKQHRKKKKSKKKQQQQQQQQKPRRSFLACPAPSRYSNAHKDSSSDEEESDNEFNDEDDSDSEVADDNSLPAMPSQNGLAQEHPQTSLEDVPLAGDSETHIASTPAPAPIKENSPTDDDNDDEDQDYDLKPKLRMLPLHKIRPTIGMNLGKVEMCGAKCHVWDLGGKMHNLWSRYYQDCDAVIFVWKIVDDEDPRYRQRDTNGGDDSDDDDIPVVTAAQQLQLLEQVRESIPDDVPFLVWGHWFPPLPTMKRDTSAYHYNVAYSTGALLPHYHNPLMTLYFGSAKSGAGVRTAMEWLIPMAARQKKYRDKAASSEEKL